MGLKKFVAHLGIEFEHAVHLLQRYSSPFIRGFHPTVVPHPFSLEKQRISSIRIVPRDILAVEFRLTFNWMPFQIITSVEDVKKAKSIF